jgi:putative monooxygenase
MNRTEIITLPASAPVVTLAPGVEVCMLASGAHGARGVTTALATFGPGAVLPSHRHPFSEVIILLEGQATVCIEGRCYALRVCDAMHVPAGRIHSVKNPSDSQKAVFHTSFASDVPTREPATQEFVMEDRVSTDPSVPESLVRFDQAPVYELAPRTHFRDLFARRFGSRGICGGYGLFEPGSSLPCHFHEYDESITIITGQAVCLAAGASYSLADRGTACIPKGRPHRFLNHSDATMAMIWVYAGDEPERTLVEPGWCDGSVVWSPSGS